MRLFTSARTTSALVLAALAVAGVAGCATVSDADGEAGRRPADGGPGGHPQQHSDPVPGWEEELDVWPRHRPQRHADERRRGGPPKETSRTGGAEGSEPGTGPAQGADEPGRAARTGAAQEVGDGAAPGSRSGHEPAGAAQRRVPAPRATAEMSEVAPRTAGRAGGPRGERAAPAAPAAPHPHEPREATRPAAPEPPAGDAGKGMCALGERHGGLRHGSTETDACALLFGR